MNPTTTQTRSLLYLLYREIVDEPDAVRIQTVEGCQSVIFEVRVAAPDVRRVIGRKGRTADACRTLIENLGAKSGGQRFLLEVVEPSVSGAHPLAADDLCIDLDAEGDTDRARELLARVVCALVDDPDQVDVTLASGLQASMLSISTAPEDIKRVIGKRGRSAGALRELLACLGGKHGRRYLMDILEPGSPTRSDRLSESAGHRTGSCHAARAATSSVR